MSKLSKHPEPEGFVSHYRILDPLGGGGMGVVYRAEDTRLERFVALKFLPPELVDDRESKQRFMREAKAASALDHPNICTIYDIGESDGRLFIAMACYRGETLKRRLERGRPKVEDAVEIVRQAAAGLAAAHERGIVHRDIKPANLFLVEDDSSPSGPAQGDLSGARYTAAGRVKILDFGLAKTDTDAGGLTQTGLFLGTPAYMSPEQTRGEEPEAPSDLWSLGVVFFELLNGQLPFAGKNFVALIHAINSEPPRTMRSDVPAGLRRIVTRLLEKDPDRRYGSGRELLADLEHWSDGSVSRPPEATVTGIEETQAMPSHLAPDVTTRTLAPRRARYFLPAILVALVIAVLWLAVRNVPQDSSETVPSSVADVDSRPSIAVLFFDNRTGDPTFDWLRTGLADMLVTDLSQSPDLRVLSTSRMYQILKQLDLADTSRGDTAQSFTVVEEIAGVAEVERVVLGSVSRAGDTLRIDIKVQDATTAEIVTSKQVAGEGEESLFSLVDDLSFSIRQGIELPPLASADAELTEVTTSSIEAYRFYIEGMRLHLEFKEEEAIQRFQEAVEIDPTFAIAWAKLGVAHRNLARGDSMEYIARALEHADRLPPIERYYIEGVYYSNMYHRWPQAIPAWENMIVIAPDHGAPYNNLALLMNFLERHEESLALTEVILNRVNPWIGTYGVAAEAHAGLGQFDEGIALLENAFEGTEDPTIQRSLAWLLMRRGDFDLAARELEQSMEVLPQPYTLSGLCAADLLRDDWQGALARAELYVESTQPAMAEYAARCRQLALQQSGRPSAARVIVDGLIETMPTLSQRAPYRILAARIDLELGRFENARTQAMLAREEAPGEVADNLGLFYGALAEIRLGRLEAARELTAEFGTLARELGFKIELRFHRRLLAELALAEGRVAEALTELEQAASTLPAHAVYNSYHENDAVPLWFAMARVYLASGDSERAAGAWKRIVDATDERFQHPIPYVRSLYLLADDYRQQGDNDLAAEYFRRFLACWADGELDREWVAEAEGFLASHGSDPSG